LPLLQKLHSFDAKKVILQKELDDEVAEAKNLLENTLIDQAQHDENVGIAKVNFENGKLALDKQREAVILQNANILKKIMPQTADVSHSTHTLVNAQQ
jgi:hypothetical protein